MEHILSKISWTRFLSPTAMAKQSMAHEWGELADHIRHSGPYAAKSVCPWIKLAEFGDQRTQKNSLRSNSNVLQITGVEGDYDGEQVRPEKAIELLERAGIRAMVYTSPSHTPQKPRWRVLAPLSVAMPRESRKALLARVNGALGGILTPESFVLSQSYFYGRVAGQDEYLVLMTFDDPEEGECVDQLDDLDQIAVTAHPVDEDGEIVTHDIGVMVARLGRKLRTKDGRREVLKRYISEKSRRGLSADEVTTLVRDVVDRYFEPEDPVDWSNVLEIVTSFTQADNQARKVVQDTVGKFVAKLEKAEPEQQGVPLLTLAQLQASAGAITWSVKHVIPADSIGVMFGGSGTFKSFIALDYALHVVHGLKWLGKKTKQGPVIFIAAEGGAGLWKRIQAWHQARNLSWADKPLYVVPMAISLADDAGQVVTAAQTLGVHPNVVIVDTMSQTFSGEENSAAEVSNYLRALGNEFRALWHCVVLVIHHSGHGATERPRGSSAIRNNVDFMLGVYRDEKEMLATMECHKQKDGELFEDAVFQMTSYQVGRDEDGEVINSLVARKLNDDEELIQAINNEKTAGRSGRNQMLLNLAQTGQQEKELRHLFYEELTGDVEMKKKAFYRARDWAIKNGFIEFVNGTLLVIEREDKTGHFSELSTDRDTKTGQK